jgi:histidinol-phosphate aminotransferase
MNLLRDEILNIAEYSLKQYPHRIKLNQNENPYELPQDIKQEILDRFAAEHWSRYPAFVPQEHIERVAAFAGWRNDGVLLGNGSNDILQLLVTCVLERNKTVVISQPTFTLYKLLAMSLGATVREVPMVEPFMFDVDGIINAANETRASLVILCSPNNPTGTCLSSEEVDRVLQSTKALVVLDEAYIHFSGTSCRALLEQYGHLVILQTFSKALGAAALRFGYALASPDMTRQLGKVKLPYSVNTLTLVAADVLMARWDTIKGWINRIVREREALFRELEKLPGVRVYTSGANFLLFETLERTPSVVFNALLKNGILIRDVSSYPMLARGLRVSIGTPEENREFLAALMEAL